MNTRDDRPSFRWLVGGLVGVAVGLALAGVIATGVLPGHGRSRDRLEHFEGVIDNGSYTTDGVKSDLYVRASRALQAGDARTAEAIYRDVIAKYPQEPDGYNALGASLVFQKRYEEAESEYRRALDLNAKSVGALYGLGCVAYLQHRDAGAKRYFEQALLLDPQNGSCHRMMGCVCEDMGDLTQAMAEYKRAIALDPVAGDAVIRQRLSELETNAGLFSGR